MEFPDLTAPYRGAVDVTSNYILPALDATPQSALSKMLRQKMGNPLERGAGILGQGASQLPRWIPGVGLMQDFASMMGPDQASAAAPGAPVTSPTSAPPAALPQRPALPPAAQAPPPIPVQMPRTAQGAGGVPAAAAPLPGAAPAPPPEVRPAAAMPATPAAPGLDPQMQAAQDALDEYYSGVIGTGATQRKAARMSSLSNSLRGQNNSPRKDLGSQVGKGARGIASAMLDYKSFKDDEKREKSLDALREAYMRSRRGESNAPIGNVTEKDFGG